MRVYYFIIVLLIFVSCSEEDEINFNQNIIGKWVVGKEIKETINDSIINKFSSNWNAEFMSNGKAYLKQFTFIDTIKWSYIKSEQLVVIIVRPYTSFPGQEKFKIQINEKNYQKWEYDYKYKMNDNGPVIDVKEIWNLSR